jgi:FMN reductase
VLLTATGGGYRHALVVEHQLRPLFAFFEAAVVPVGVYAASADLGGGSVASDVALRLQTAVGQLIDLLPQHHRIERPASSAA